MDAKDGRNERGFALFGRIRARETRAVRRARFGESKRAGFVPSFQSRGVALDQKSRSSKNSAVLAGTRSAWALSLSAKQSVSTSASALRVPSNRATRPQVKSCLEVFNAVSDSAGAEDQGMRSVPDKSQFNAAMENLHGDGENRQTVGWQRRRDFGEGEHGFIEFGTICGGTKVVRWR